MDQSAYNISLQRWEALIYEANASGMRKREWCRLHGIGERQFYYWQRKIRKKAISQFQQGSDGTTLSVKEPAFIELQPPVADEPAQVDGKTAIDGRWANERQEDLVLRFGAYEIQVAGPETEDTLRMVLKVIRDA